MTCYFKNGEFVFLDVFSSYSEKHNMRDNEMKQSIGLNIDERIKDVFVKANMEGNIREQNGDSFWAIPIIYHTKNPKDSRINEIDVITRIQIHEPNGPPNLMTPDIILPINSYLPSQNEVNIAFWEGQFPTRALSNRIELWVDAKEIIIAGYILSKSAKECCKQNVCNIIFDKKEYLIYDGHIQVNSFIPENKVNTNFSKIWIENEKLHIDKNNASPYVLNMKNCSRSIKKFGHKEDRETKDFKEMSRVYLVELIETEQDQAIPLLFVDSINKEYNLKKLCSMDVITNIQITNPNFSTVVPRLIMQGGMGVKFTIEDGGWELDLELPKSLLVYSSLDIIDAPPNSTIKITGLAISWIREFNRNDNFLFRIDRHTYKVNGHLIGQKLEEKVENNSKVDLINGEFIFEDKFHYSNMNTERLDFAINKFKYSEKDIKNTRSCDTCNKAFYEMSYLIENGYDSFGIPMSITYNKQNFLLTPDGLNLKVFDVVTRIFVKRTVDYGPYLVINDKYFSLESNASNWEWTGCLPVASLRSKNKYKITTSFSADVMLYPNGNLEEVIIEGYQLSQKECKLMYDSAQDWSPNVFRTTLGLTEYLICNSEFIPIQESTGKYSRVYINSGVQCIDPRVYINSGALCLDPGKTVVYRNKTGKVIFPEGVEDNEGLDIIDVMTSDDPIVDIHSLSVHIIKKIIITKKSCDIRPYFKMNNIFVQFSVNDDGDWELNEFIPVGCLQYVHLSIVSQKYSTIIIHSTNVNYNTLENLRASTFTVVIGGFPQKVKEGMNAKITWDQLKEIKESNSLVAKPVEKESPSKVLKEPQEKPLQDLVAKVILEEHGDLHKLTLDLPKDTLFYNYDTKDKNAYDLNGKVVTELVKRKLENEMVGIPIRFGEFKITEDSTEFILPSWKYGNIIYDLAVCSLNRPYLKIGEFIFEMELEKNNCQMDCSWQYPYWTFNNILPLCALMYPVVSIINLSYHARIQIKGVIISKSCVSGVCLSFGDNFKIADGNIIKLGDDDSKQELLKAKVLEDQKIYRHDMNHSDWNGKVINNVFHFDCDCLNCKPVKKESFPEVLSESIPESSSEPFPKYTPTTINIVNREIEVVEGDIASPFREGPNCVRRFILQTKFPNKFTGDLLENSITEQIICENIPNCAIPFEFEFKNMSSLDTYSNASLINLLSKIYVKNDSITDGITLKVGGQNFPLKRISAFEWEFTCLMPRSYTRLLELDNLDNAFVRIEGYRTIADLEDTLFEYNNTTYYYYGGEYHTNPKVKTLKDKINYFKNKIQN